MKQVMSVYRLIPPMSSISEITQAHHYYDVPDTWYIALTDVIASTQAIADGRYKEVCAVATASVAAQLNIMQEKDAPFVFGGDGASVLIPPESYEASQKALAGTRKLAREQFNLDLRVGLIPVQDILSSGHPIRVARLEMSANFQQAIFSGGGMRYAEQLLKDNAKNSAYLIPDDVESVADFYGIECRWRSIPSSHDENISLMLMATGNTQADDDNTYRQVLEQIEAIYGDSISRHPIALQDLQLTLNPRQLNVEGRIRHQEALSLKTTLQMMWGTFKGYLALRFKLGQWGTYKQIFIEATDHEKFDDTLRMIFSGNSQQRQTLTAYLDEQHQQGKLVYGISISQASLVTCIVYDYFGHQMHLIDGENGGYTLASRAMKAQLQG